MKKLFQLNEKSIKSPTWTTRDSNDDSFQPKSEQTCIFQLKKTFYHFEQRTIWYVSSSVKDAKNISTIHPYFSTIQTTHSTDHPFLNINISRKKNQTVIFVKARIFSSRLK